MVFLIAGKPAGLGDPTSLVDVLVLGPECDGGTPSEPQSQEPPVAIADSSDLLSYHLHGWVGGAKQSQILGIQ